VRKTSLNDTELRFERGGVRRENQWVGDSCPLKTVGEENFEKTVGGQGKRRKCLKRRRDKGQKMCPV